MAWRFANMLVIRMQLKIDLICITISAMYVCLCKAITDRQLQQAIDNGAKSVKALNTKLGVATGCGKCVGEVRCMLNDGAESSAGGVSGGHSLQQKVPSNP